MPVLGVTGAIGAGKTSLAAALEALGARRIDADALAREAIAPGGPAHAAVLAAFGADLTRPEGTIDRARLAARGFADAAAWRRLNAIVHPHVIAAARAALAAAPSAPWVLDVPLLFESGMDALCDAVVVVAAPREARYARLAARGLVPEEAVRREALLMDDGERRRRSDAVVENAGSEEDLRRAAASLFERYLMGDRGRGA